MQLQLRSNDKSGQEEFLDQVAERLMKENWIEKDIKVIRLAMTEALTNAMKHGNQEDPSKMVTIEVKLQEDEFAISIEDEGKGFNPDELPDPTDPENLERSCGRGVFIIRTYMKVVFNESGNRITMRKERSRQLQKT